MSYPRLPPVRASVLDRFISHKCYFCHWFFYKFAHLITALFLQSHFFHSLLSKLFTHYSCIIWSIVAIFAKKLLLHILHRIIYSRMHCQLTKTCQFHHRNFTASLPTFENYLLPGKFSLSASANMPSSCKMSPFSYNGAHYDKYKQNKFPIKYGHCADNRRWFTSSPAFTQLFRLLPCQSQNSYLFCHSAAHFCLFFGHRFSPQKALF